MKSFIIHHRLAIVIAFLVGAVSFLPYVLMPLILGNSYQDVPFFYQDAEDIYLARIQEVLDGHVDARSPIFYEYKDIPDVLKPFGEWFYAIPAFFLSLSATTVALATKFLFPAVLFLLVYALVVRVLEEEAGSVPWSALLAGTLVTLGTDFIHPHYFLQVLQGAFDYPYLSLWTRLVNPITGALLLFSFLHILLTLRRDTRAVLVIVAGVILGIQSGYIFTFILSGAILICACIVAFVTRHYRLFAAFVAVGVIALAINIPYLISIVGGMGTPEGLSVSLKNGLFVTHLPLWNKFLTLVGAMLLVSLFVPWSISAPSSRARENWWWMSVLVVTASCIALNIQVILGKTVWPQHFVQYSVPLGFVVLVLAAHVCSSRLRIERIWRAVAIICICLSFALQAGTVWTATSVMDDFVRRQEIAPLFRTLNAVPGDCVVLVSEKREFINRLIPAYTHCDTYNSSYVFMVPADRIQHNFYLEMRLAGVTSATIRSYLSTYDDDIRLYFYRHWGDAFYNQADPWLSKIYPPEESRTYLDLKKEELIRGYEVFVSGDLVKQVTTYRVDYFVIDDEARSLPMFPNGFLAPVFSKNGITLYMVRHGSTE